MCLCVCMYACMHACVRACVRVCVCACVNNLNSKTAGQIELNFGGDNTYGV